MVADLADDRNFNKEAWESRALGPYLQWFTGGKTEGKEVACKSLEAFIEADKVRKPCFFFFSFLSRTSVSHVIPH